MKENNQINVSPLGDFVKALSGNSRECSAEGLNGPSDALREFVGAMLGYAVLSDQGGDSTNE